MRIAIGAFMYEANSFSPVQTTLDDFAAGTLVRGPALLDYFRDTNTEVAGFLHSCAAIPDAEIVPLLAADANPAGLVQAATYTALRDELLDRLAQAQRTQPLDAVLLALHGAMVAEGEDDPEGAVLAAVRDIVGPAVLIAASLDLHANVTARMAAAADVLVGYRTYPHVDQRRTGERAAAPALAAAQGGPRPRTVVQKVPLIVPAETMQTTHGPMHEVRAEADWLEAEGAALAVSVFGMQPWLDLPEAGCSIVVVGTEAGDSHVHARRLARQFWQRRKAFDVPLVAPDVAVQRALAAERGPVLLVDSADATSAGSPGDSVAVLQALLDAGCGHTDGAAGLCLVPLVDPPAAAAAHATGAGETLTLPVGGTLDPEHSASVAVTGRIERLTDGRVLRKGPAYTGMAMDAGPTAVLAIGAIRLLLMSRTIPTSDPEIYRAAGLEPATARIVVVKSPNLFRAAYGPFAQDIILLDTPGVSSPNLHRFNWQRIGRPIYPLDDFTWDPTAAGGPQRDR